MSYNTYIKVKVSRTNHNKLFKYDKRSLLSDLFNSRWCYKNFYKDNKIVVEKHPSLLYKVVLILRAPFLYIAYGFFNKELHEGIKEVLWSTKYKVFVEYTITKPDEMKTLLYKDGSKT